MRPFHRYILKEHHCIINIGGEDKRSPIDPDSVLFFQMKTQFLATIKEVKKKSWIPEDSWVAWLNNRDVHQYIQGAKGVLFGSDSAVVNSLSDKAWTLRSDSTWNVSQSFSPDELQNALQCMADMKTHIIGHPQFDRWVLKPRFGTSGRGFTYLDDVQTQSVLGLDMLIRDQVRSFARLMEQGGFILEPWVERMMDFSTQWWIHENGHIDYLAMLKQDMTKHGLCRGHKWLPRLPSQVILQDALTMHRDIVEQIKQEGYYGPLGLDGFTYRSASGDEQLRPVNEVNPRFTMGTLFVLSIET